mmetsp:Transcript_6518/g.12014  ORF Transcript_6518/g.12014 Transcript_6518/m.12014 type:complete len:403 (+) Transcript_6518:1089-2297(+)
MDRDGLGGFSPTETLDGFLHSLSVIEKGVNFVGQFALQQQGIRGRRRSRVLAVTAAAVALKSLDFLTAMAPVVADRNRDHPRPTVVPLGLTAPARLALSFRVLPIVRALALVGGGGRQRRPPLLVVLPLLLRSPRHAVVIGSTIVLGLEPLLRRLRRLLLGAGGSLGLLGLAVRVAVVDGAFEHGPLAVVFGDVRLLLASHLIAWSYVLVVFHGCLLPLQHFEVVAHLHLELVLSGEVFLAQVLRVNLNDVALSDLHGVVQDNDGTVPIRGCHVGRFYTCELRPSPSVSWLLAHEAFQHGAGGVYLSGEVVDGGVEFRPHLEIGRRLLQLADSLVDPYSADDAVEDPVPLHLERACMFLLKLLLELLSVLLEVEELQHAELMGYERGRVGPDISVIKDPWCN